VGLRSMQVFYPLPKYSKIETLLPLEENSRNSLLPAATARPQRWRDRLRSGRPAGCFARSFIMVGQRPPASRSLLSELIAAARAQCTEPALADGGEWNLGQYEVRRRTGKLYLHLTARDGTRLLGKVPLEPMGQLRIRTGFEALSVLHKSTRVSDATKAVAPRVFGCASVGGHEIFLEEWKPGVKVRRGGTLREGLVSQAMQLLTHLHRETQERLSVDEAVYARYFGRHFDALHRWFSAAERSQCAARINRLNAFCHDQVIGAELPIVLRHGDFSLTNCLFDPRSKRLAVLVDWDMAELRGLPLTDGMRILLHVRADANADGRALLETSLRGIPEVLLSDEHCALYADYLHALDIADRMFLPLGVIYWAQLVNHHYPVHRCRWDRSWRDENLIALLGRWEQLLHL
jgi:hypothetical protein